MGNCVRVKPHVGPVIMCQPTPIVIPSWSILEVLVRLKAAHAHCDSQSNYPPWLGHWPYQCAVSNSNSRDQSDPAYWLILHVYNIVSFPLPRVHVFDIALSFLWDDD